MNTADLLFELKRLGVKLWADAGELRYDAPAGVLKSDLRGELRRRKAEVLDVLHSVQRDDSWKFRPIAHVPRDKHLPLSFAQQRLWYSQQVAPESAFYNIPLTVELEGSLNVAALRWSLNQLIERHETLRTTFHVEQGEPFQIIGDPSPLDLEFIDLARMPETRRESEVARRATQEVRRLFDLSVGPLVRAALMRVSDRKHVLVLAMHHIVLDIWSVGVLFRDLSGLYDEFTMGRGRSRLPSLPVQYADFAVWQRKWLTDQVLEGDLGYWRERLADLPTLELPTDRPRPPMQSFRGDSEIMSLGAELSKSLRELSRQQGKTIFMTLLAAFKALLCRYTSQADIVVGAPIANRNRAEIEELIGFFSNSLVMRSDLSGDPPFIELLTRVRDTAVQAFAHDDLPFEKLVDELQPTRDTSRHPLFQVTFAVHNAPMGPLKLEGLTLRPLPIGFETTRFDLEAYAWETPAGLQACFIYNTDLFDPPTISRMLHHFRNVLEAVVRAPGQRISDLSLLSAAERHQLLVEWNATTTDYPRDATIPGLFEAQVEARPQAVAVQFEDRQLSYGELNARSNRLAHYLRHQGVGPEVMVGIAVERSLELVVGILGILKAGGAYVPLDVDYPKSRLAFMVKDTKAPVLLTQSRFLERLPQTEARVVCLDSDWAAIGEESEANPVLEIKADKLAYVIYTSGSTGRPKGTCIEQRSVVRLVKETNYLEVGPEEVYLQYAAVSFDASTLEFWGSLLNGGKLVVSPPGVLSLEELGRVIRDAGVTTLWLTAALFQQMVNEQAQALRGVRQLLAGGEALSVAPVKRMLELLAPGARLINGYGPTENTTFTCCHVMTRESEAEHTVPIGRPISNTKVYVLDKQMQPVPVGVPGELYIGGDGLAREYLNQPALTEEKFVADPFDGSGEGRLYRTGDRVRWRADGTIEFLGRFDHQVKVRGYRIELGEIETALVEHPGVKEAVVLAREDAPGDKRLVAYVTAAEGARLSVPELKGQLQRVLPQYMVPPAFVELEALPLTPNGKVDREALPEPEGERQVEDEYVAPRGELEERIAAIWREVLKLERVGVRDNFFDLGGHSLLVLKARAKLEETLGIAVPAVMLFQHPTVDALAAHLSGELDERRLADEARARVERRGVQKAGTHAIAIIGMAGRFPGAPDLERFWSNLRDGVESIRFFSEEELRSAGVDESLLSDPNYVPARGALDDAELFDASFFGYTPREAELTDPQQRVFLECASQALEDAGCDPQRYAGLIGVYAGASSSSYLTGQSAVRTEEAGLSLLLASGSDFLPTRVSYKLNLHGPSVNVQTACSTSLVAVHAACRALLDQECDMALAGGVSIVAPRVGGYLYQEQGIASPDGHCRAFDASAQGTVGGEGVGIVVLKRLEEALADGDTIHAVIRGTAINNDGSDKVGFTAPSVEWQAGAIAQAGAEAGVEPGSISYVETHGTGTALGDPIEIAALSRVFGKRGAEESRCALGALKSNIGHLDAAAGVAGLIKTVLELQHRELVPTVHFHKPNPEIDFANSPFYVNAELQEWQSKNGVPRRAGVSSFGMGGTNAHAVLEEAPEVAPSAAPSREEQLLVLSAKTATALEAMTSRLAEHLEAHPQLALADVAYTLQVGRRQFSHRRAVVCQSNEGAVATLRAGAGWSGCSSEKAPEVVFMFPGQGSQHVGMGRELYESEALYREAVDRCCEWLQPQLGLDLRTVLYAQEGEEEANAERLKQTALTQPALFVVEYALAELWKSWGIRPAAMIGHSIGECVAACLSGVMSLADALEVVAQRGRLMQGMPPGAMVAVAGTPEQLEPLLEERLSVAARNEPGMSVVSGPVEAVEALEARLAAEEVHCQRLHTSHAFHSAMMEPVLEPFAQLLGCIELKAPEIPFISNLTGTWITPQQATDPSYWVQHLRRTVRFGAGVEELLKSPDRVLLEVGPGNVLTSLAGRHPAVEPGHAVIASMRHPRDEQPDLEALLNALGRLWLGGIEVDWGAYYSAERRRRVALPTYPFQRQRYWVEASAKAGAEESRAAGAVKRASVSNWFYLPSWRRYASKPATVSPHKLETDGGWLVFAGSHGLGREMAGRLREMGGEVIVVTPGNGFGQPGENTFTVNPGSAEDYLALFKVVVAREKGADNILHLWGLDTENAGRKSLSLTDMLDRSFYSLVFIAQALGSLGVPDGVHITVVANNLHEVTGEEDVCPEKSTLLGACKVVGEEYPGMICRSIDTGSPTDSGLSEVIERVLVECTQTAAEPVVAYRGAHRWVPTIERVELAGGERLPARLHEGGVYLITGGLGGIGLEIGEYLARIPGVKLILVGRRGLPARDEWDDWLVRHGDSDSTSRKIQKAQALEAFGAEVLVADADVSDREQVEAVREWVHGRFGKVHGIVHSAGIAGGGMIELKSRDMADAVLAPKVAGTLVLDAVFRNEGLDFLVLCSSLTSILGGIGQVDYCAANAFLDAFASCPRSSETHVVSIAWDTWRDVGMAVETKIPDGLDEWRNRSLIQGMSCAEGRDVFGRVLNTQYNRVYVSTTGLVERLESNEEKARTLLPGGFGEKPGPKDSAHSRPSLSTDFVAPRNDLERIVASTWQGLFGIDQIGVEDDFFELGGHSLLATQLLNKLSRTCSKAKLSLRNLFENPTVAQLAGLIADAEHRQLDRDTPSVRDRVCKASIDEREAIVVDYLREQIEQTSGPDTLRLTDNDEFSDQESGALVTELIWLLKRDFQLPVYPRELSSKRSLPALARFIVSELGSEVDAGEGTSNRPPVFGEPSPSRWAEIRKSLPKVREKNKQAVFLLSAPRSGSTLLRLMLGGHSALFCPPELGLLSYDYMGQRPEHWNSEFSSQGIILAFATLMGHGVEAAKALVEDLVHRNTSVQEVYRLLQDRAGTRRLVDKSPVYAMRIETLQRIEELFDKPSYIHLVRHPYAVIESFVRNRLEKWVGEEGADPQAVAEKYWALNNGNILELSGVVEPMRYHLVRYEQLVQDPATTMESLCEFLGVPFEDAVLHPYQGHRMIDGPGDPDIFQHKGIEARLGETWKRVRLPRPLSEYSRSLAVRFDYVFPDEAEAGQMANKAEASGKRLAPNVDQLSDDQVDAMLAEYLRNKETAR